MKQPGRVKALILLFKSQNSDPLEAVICSVSPGRGSQTCSGQEAFYLHLGQRCIFHIQFAITQTQTEGNWMRTSSSPKCLITPSWALNCTSQNFLKTETVKAKKGPSPQQGQVFCTSAQCYCAGCLRSF